MKERIFEIIKQNQLTAWRFAELLEVQPSSISHILSGRNKPSFDFIEKILTRFPEISPDWLILGHGEMVRVGYNEDFVIHESGQDLEPTLFDSSIEDDSVDLVVTNVNHIVNEKNNDSLDKAFTNVITDNTREISSKNEESSHILPIANMDKVERVMIFYTNGTFSTYTPR